MAGRYLDMAGAPTGFRHHPLYERAPVTNLFLVLNKSAEAQWYRAEKREGTDDDFCLAHVYGPPGTGKSSAAWKWAHEATGAANCPMAYVECDSQICYILDPARRMSQNPIQETSLDALEAFLFPGGTYRRVICIFDQALANNIDHVVGLILRLVQKGAAVTLVSSECVTLNAGSFNVVNVVDYRFPGWTLEEFKNACVDLGFFNSIKGRAFGEAALHNQRDRLIEDKFFLAGCSARFMFQSSDAKIKSKIDEKVATFQPTIQSVSVALRSPKCNGAVNTLISWHDPIFQGPTPLNQTPSIRSTAFTDPASDAPTMPTSRTGYGTKNCFVSQYAAQKVIEHMFARSDELRSMGMTIKEPSVVGYGFQQRFWELLNTHEQSKTGLNLRLSGESASQSWQVLTVLSDDPIETLQDVSSTGLSPGTWFWCVGNTAAYDAIVMYAVGRIRFVQVTAAASHSFKIYAVDSFLRLLKVRGIEFTHVDFVVVRPNDDTRAFTLETPVGSLNRYNDYKGTRWVSGDNCRSQVRYATVGWE